MSALMDIWNTIMGIVTSSDLITLAIIVVIALGAGFMMQSFGSIVSTTFVALLVFVVAMFVREIAMNGANAAQLVETDWQAFVSLQMLTLLAYAIAFAVLIAVVHFVRSLVMR